MTYGVEMERRFNVASERKINITQHSSLGTLWCGGWLFTIGYLELSFWKGAMGILIWPYYIGAHFSAVAN